MLPPSHTSLVPLTYASLCSNGELKKREKDFQAALQTQVDKARQLESKLRMTQAQLRMSRINTDEMTSGELFKANLQVELGTPSRPLILKRDNSVLTSSLLTLPRTSSLPFAISFALNL